MDYVVGSVAALVSGNVTPNRPKFRKRALTPTKHQPSPNVTPKSELAEDRSIFLSPTLQKKKAIVKKSPKRIFQNPEVDVSNDGKSSQNSKSPKADKVKKHLKEELEADADLRPKSLKNKKSKIKDVLLLNNLNNEEVPEGMSINTQVQNECTPKKKKKNKINKSNNTIVSTLVASNEDISYNDSDNITNVNSHVALSEKWNMSVSSPTKIKNQVIKTEECESKDNNGKENVSSQENNLPTPNPKRKRKMHFQEESIQQEKSKKKKKHKPQSENNDNIDNNRKDTTDVKELPEDAKSTKKKNRKPKNKLKKNKVSDNTENANQVEETEENFNMKTSKKKKKDSITVNRNAITDKDTDSEHDSDDEIESENEQNNKEVLEAGPAEESSDEEEQVQEKKKNEQKNKDTAVNTEEEVKRTLFVGNVLFSAKCKKEIKKIFNKYGQIETVRIRTIPVKDGSVTPKQAVIKRELHPDRSTVNVYVKFRDVSSVKAALAENGTALNGCHLRVTASDCTGSEHDRRCSVFVGNLPFALEDEALRRQFAQCGEIVSVRIIRDRKTGAGKGFGYVNFKSKDAVELALALSDEELTLGTRVLRVKRCQQTANKQSWRDRGGAPSANRGTGRVPANHRSGNAQGDHGGAYSHRYGGGKAPDRNRFGNRDVGRRIVGANNNLREADGAVRGLVMKRKNQDVGEGPPNKMRRGIMQPGKKTRREFVGVTAEKKKRNKFNKGQKKKKALSEILTK